MQVHPGKKIQEELKDRGWTQRQFAFLLGKKVSEVNELIKGKRNITVQWDILLSHVLGTSRKYWLALQNEYDYEIVEKNFDFEKIKNQDLNVSIKLDKHGSTLINIDKLGEEKDHQISEQKDTLQKVAKDSEKLQKIEHKEILEEGIKTNKPASNHNNKSDKEHKIDKDVDISKQQEKHQNSTLQNVEKNSKNLQKIVENGKKNIPAKQNLSKLDSNTKTSSPEGQKKGEEKKDKNSWQKIYNHNDKFDSYFPAKEKKLEHSKHSDKAEHKKNLSSKDENSSSISSLSFRKENKILEGQEKKDEHKDHHKHKEHIFRNF